MVGIEDGRPTTEDRRQMTGAGRQWKEDNGHRLIKQTE